MDFTNPNKAVILVATHAVNQCDPWSSTAVQIHKAGVPHERIPINSYGLNSDGVRSDFSGRHGFAIAFQLDPGKYDLTLYTMKQYLYFGGKKYTKPDLGSLSVAAGDVVYIGTFKTTGCGTVLLSVQEEWVAISNVFIRLYPDLGLGRVKVIPFELPKE